MKSETGLTIATDLDEVLSRTNDEMRDFSLRKYGEFVPKQVPYHDFSKVWGCSKEESIRRWREFGNDPAMREIKPYEGSVEAIKYLKIMGNELYVITGREIFTEEMTNEWIQRYYPKQFSGVFFASHPYMKTDRKTKAEICRELEADLYIDDDAGCAKMCAIVVKNVLLYNQIWNQNSLLSRNIHRVCSWQEIVAFADRQK